MPGNPERGLAYAETLFGVILNLSCLPKTVEGFIEYFESPLEAVSIEIIIFFKLIIIDLSWYFCRL